MVRRLAEERARQGLSQAEVARQMGVTPPYIAKFEKALSDPRLSTLLRYASIVLGAMALGALLGELAKLASSEGGPSAGPPR
jgi:transcriptional regulator with XRE-family HTH domain